MLGYGNILIQQTNNDLYAMTFKDTSYREEIAELVGQAPVDFTSMRLFSAGGTFILGTGFLFQSLEEAQRTATRIVEEIYRRHGE